MRSLCLAILAVGLALSAPASAQLASALGKPLPSQDLPAGTVSVHVIAGDLAQAVRGTKVTLVLGKERREVTTDDTGHAVFANVPAGATVQASVAGAGGKRVSSESFEVPADGGTRVMLSTKPFVEPAVPAIPSSLEIADDLPTGTIDVHLDGDVAAGAKITAVLVGYTADERVQVTTRSLDANHHATFDHLDNSGATTYFVMGEVARGRTVDRLETQPMALRAGTGARAELHAGHARAAAVDDLTQLEKQEAVPAGTVRARIGGAHGPTSSVAIIDASTGKTIAHLASIKDHGDLRVAVPPDHVLYAEATIGGHTYRSLPFQTVKAHGTVAGVYPLPRVIARYGVDGQPAGSSLFVVAEIELSNNAWMPFALDHDLPLPRGILHAKLVEADGAAVELSGAGLHFTSPLPPGPSRAKLSFELPASAGKVAWSLDLPYGSWDSRVRIVDEPGVTLEPPAGVTVERDTLDRDHYLTAADITIAPNQVMVFEVTLPRLPPKLAATAHACAQLAPDYSPLLGKPAPELAAPQLDGRSLRLEALRGKIVVVTFTATWVSVAQQEPAQLASLPAAVRDAVPLLVFSDKDAKDVRAAIDARAPYRVVLDPPAGDGNIGAITTAWGTHLLPESYVVDRKGVVRYYFANNRDWSSPEARACVQSLAAE